MNLTRSDDYDTCDDFTRAQDHHHQEPGHMIYKLQSSLTHHDYGCDYHHYARKCFKINK